MTECTVASGEFGTIEGGRWPGSEITAAHFERFVNRTAFPILVMAPFGHYVIVRVSQKFLCFPLLFCSM